ncbi:MAG: hypothetical protein LBS99_07520, partial [Clostridiales bacterium]|nr:hypothetical protein [Clostridiales bacterium]
MQEDRFKGFQDFKLSLSRELSDSENSTETDKSIDIAEEMKDAVTRTNKEITYDDCLEIASHIIAAKRVYLSAVGNSAVTALAVKLKLLKA